MAVNRVSFDLKDVAVTGLVGPNGSGKTTLFHVITGFYPLDEGEVLFDGRPITALAPHRISRMGLIRTFQHSRVLVVSFRPGQFAGRGGGAARRAAV